MFNIRKVINNQIVHAQKKNKAFKLVTPYTIATPGSFFTEDSNNYLNPSTLAIISYNTVKEIEALEQFVANTSNSSKSDFFIQAIKSNRSNVSQYAKKLQSDIKSHNDFSANGWIGVAYTLNVQGILEKAYFESYILPGLQNKIEYANLDGLIDLTHVLVNLGYGEENQFYGKVTSLLKAKLAVSRSSWYSRTFEILYQLFLTLQTSFDAITYSGCSSYQFEKPLTSSFDQSSYGQIYSGKAKDWILIKYLGSSYLQLRQAIF